MKVFAVISLLVAAASAQTADQIRVIIRDDFHKNAKFAGAVINSPFAPNTYQLKAREETASRLAGTGANSQTIINHYVLRCIYAATNGVSNPRTGGLTNIPKWTNTTGGWATNSANYCGYYGITCSGGYVTDIVLNQNSLYGTWPAEIAFIGDTLEQIDIYANFFNYCETYEWFKSMDKLNYLFFGTTSWDSNGIPSVLKFLDALCKLHFIFLSCR
jgi:hypothetical protein